MGHRGGMVSRVDPANMAEVLTARVRHHDERCPAQRVNSALEDFSSSPLSSVLTPGRRSLPMQVDKFAEELKSAREYNDTINRLLQVRTSWGFKRRLLFFNTTTSARENPTVQPPTASLTPLPFASQDQLGTVADDDTLPSTSYSRRSKKKSHKARERERPRGDTDSVRVEKARRQALESPKLRVRTPSDINAARIGASAQKAAALEDEIRRLQRDVKHHREAEANLQAAMDAAENRGSVRGPVREQAARRSRAPRRREAHGCCGRKRSSRG